MWHDGTTAPSYWVDALQETTLVVGSAVGLPQVVVWNARVTDRISADFTIGRAPGPPTLKLLGDRVTLSLRDAPSRPAKAGVEDDAVVDIGDLGRVDTSGAFALMQVITREQADRIDVSKRPDLQRLMVPMKPGEGPRAGNR